MEAVRVITGRAVPLVRSDVDTDQIIPSDWLKRVERTGFGAGLFSEWRENSDFVLNQERYAGANILVAGSNFGTGSSREHAVWALMDYGFAAVLSPRFADIFRNNSGKMGLVAATVPHDAVQRLWDAIEEDPNLEIVVDVEHKRVAAPAIGLDVAFELDDFTQHRLLNGLDDIGLTLAHGDDITTLRVGPRRLDAVGRPVTPDRRVGVPAQAGGVRATSASSRSAQTSTSSSARSCGRFARHEVVEELEHAHGGLPDPSTRLVPCNNGKFPPLPKTFPVGEPAVVQPGQMRATGTSLFDGSSCSGLRPERGEELLVARRAWSRRRARRWRTARPGRRRSNTSP